MLSNLFTGTRRLTSSKEDHLTEFLASALLLNAKFNVDFSNHLLGAFAISNGWAIPRIKSVVTQKSFPHSNCCPDMLFTLEDNHVVICENKIDAMETMGSSSDPRSQLLRYLDLPVDGVAYIRSGPKQLALDVVSHPKFIANEGHHFLWRDFYPLLSRNSNLFITWIRKGFESMGFTPAHPIIGDLSDFSNKVNEKNRQRFNKYWESLISYSNKRNWKNDPPTKNAELYLYPNNCSKIRQIFISPSKFERFLVRLTPKDGENVETIYKTLSGLKIDGRIEINSYFYKNADCDVIDIVSTLNYVIGDRTTVAKEIELNLTNFVSSFIDLM